MLFLILLSKLCDRVIRANASMDSATQILSTTRLKNNRAHGRGRKEKQASTTSTQTEATGRKINLAQENARKQGRYMELTVAIT